MADKVMMAYILNKVLLCRRESLAVSGSPQTSLGPTRSLGTWSPRLLRARKPSGIAVQVPVVAEI